MHGWICNLRDIRAYGQFLLFYHGSTEEQQQLYCMMLESFKRKSHLCSFLCHFIIYGLIFYEWVLNQVWNNPSDYGAWNCFCMWQHLAALQVFKKVFSLNQMSQLPVQVYTVTKGPTVINEVMYYIMTPTEETRLMMTDSGSLWSGLQVVFHVNHKGNPFRSQHFTGQLCDPSI